MNVDDIVGGAPAGAERDFCGARNEVANVVDAHVATCTYYAPSACGFMRARMVHAPVRDACMWAVHACAANAHGGSKRPQRRVAKVPR